MLLWKARPFPVFMVKARGGGGGICYESEGLQWNLFARNHFSYIRKSQGSLIYSKPSGPSNEHLISWRQPCFEQETGARWCPPSLYHHRTEAAESAAGAVPQHCHAKALCYSVRSWPTPTVPKCSHLRSPRRTHLLTWGARGWQSCAAGCPGCASQRNAPTRPRCAAGTRPGPCPPWCTAGEGTQGGQCSCHTTAQGTAHSDQSNKPGHSLTATGREELLHCGIPVFLQGVLKEAVSVMRWIQPQQGR